MLRVIIKRHCLPGREEELEDLLVELRGQAMPSGYVSGETLRSLSDPSVFLVLSTWRDAELWHLWEKSRRRMEISRRIEPMLKGPEEVSLYRFVSRPFRCDADLDEVTSLDTRMIE
jgi:heme-degrading monooxygenase HmoA